MCSQVSVGRHEHGRLAEAKVGGVGASDKLHNAPDFQRLQCEPSGQADIRTSLSLITFRLSARCQIWGLWHPSPQTQNRAPEVLVVFDSAQDHVYDTRRILGPLQVQRHGTARGSFGNQTATPPRSLFLLQKPGALRSHFRSPFRSSIADLLLCVAPCAKACSGSCRSKWWR